MRVSHSFPAISATFDDPNLVSCAGLAPTMALAQRAGLADLVADTLTLKAIGGVNAHLKVPALVAGMVAGADSIDDMDVLRHGGMGRLFTGVRAPSTLGTFLRTFTFGHVRQLDAVASRFLTALAKNAPILPGIDQVCYVDIDDSIKARMNPAVTTAISSIPESAWTPIHYPKAIWDHDEQRFISDAQVAEVPFTAFTSRRQNEHINGRLIVRRVKRLNHTSVSQGQGELFAQYRHHGVITDSPLTMLQAETDHRDHAIVEQVIADLKASALAHLPSGSFAVNSAWLVLAVIAFNLTRAAGTIASVFH